VGSKQTEGAGPAQPAAPTTLLRALGPADLAALMVNATIGSGILGLPGKLYALTGAYSLLVCLAGGVLVGLVAASFAAAASRFTSTGGATRFAHAAFGPAAGGIAGALALTSAAVSYAAIANLVLTYAAALLPGIDAGAARAAALAAITAALFTLVYRGVRLSARTHTVFAVVKFALLFGFAALALPAILRHPLPASPLPPAANWTPALVFMLYGLTGLESTVISNGEMRDPARDIPGALALGVIAVSTIYGVVLLACMATVPDLAHSSRPVYDGAREVGGAIAGALVIAGGCVSMLGVMFVIAFALPRIVFALAEAGQMPAALARLHTRFQTPHLAVRIIAPAAFCLAWSASFVTALQLAVLARLALYTLTALAAAVLARRGFAETATPLNLPGGALIPAAAALLCAALFARTLLS